MKAFRQEDENDEDRGRLLPPAQGRDRAVPGADGRPRLRQRRPALRLQHGHHALEEVSRLLFVWLTFLGAIIAMREHGHLGVDTLVKRLPAAGKKACLVVSILLMLYATWLLLVGSWQQTVINLGVASPAAGFSMGLLYGVGVLFAVSAGLILLHDLYRVLTGRMSEDELVMVKESEEQEELESPAEGARRARPRRARRPPPGAPRDRRRRPVAGPHGRLGVRSRGVVVHL
jgi:TRAP-type C4-dicarboxylate transport system permease small subunit